MGVPPVRPDGRDAHPCRINFKHPDSIPMKTNTALPPTIVSPEKWLAARREFLREEKEFSRLRDRLAEHRRALPWVKIEKPYVFGSTDGPESLGELFEGRSQLIIYHFMLAPGWDEGCRGC